MNHVALEAKERDGRAQRDQGPHPIKSAGKALGPQDVVAKKQRQVEDDPDYGGGDGRQGRCELELAVNNVSTEIGMRIIDEAWLSKTAKA
jgi:hypothetical protein